MKKKFLSIVTLSALIGLPIAMLSSCDEPTGPTQTTKYTVSYDTTSSDYTINGLNAEYASGETVSFTVTINNDAKEIDSVKIGTTTINPVNGTYTFQMPAQNVTIEVTLKDKEAVEPPVEHTLTVTANSTEVSEGLAIQLEVKFDGALKTEGYTITADDSTLVQISGTSVVAIKSGTVTLTVNYLFEGVTYTQSIVITIIESDTMTIAEAKTKEIGTMVTIRATVTASGGTSAYLSDSTGGIYVYNWYFETDDTAITNKMWTVGQSVEVRAKLTESPNGEHAIQLSSYENGAPIEGAYAYTIDQEVVPMTPILLNENVYRNLTIDEVGNLYTFTAVYLSGEPTTDKAQDVIFKLGESTEITLRTDGSSSKMYDNDIQSLVDSWEEMNLTAGDEVQITAPLSWFYDPQFAYISHGTTITKTGNHEDVFVPDPFEEYRISDIKKFAQNAEYNGVAYYLGRNDNAYTKGDELTYNAVYVGDGTEYYMLYNVPARYLPANLVPGETIIAWGGIVSDYNGIKESTVTSMGKLSTFEGLEKPVIPTLNAENSLTLSEDLMSAKVKIEGATVTNVTSDSNENKTITFTVGNNSYSLYLDSRYTNLDGTLAGSLKVGDVFDTYSFVSSNNGKYQFVYVDELTVKGGGTVDPEPEPSELNTIDEVLAMANGTNYKVRGYWMGSCNADNMNYGNYNAAYIADGEDSYLLYRLDKDLISSLTLIPGETIVEVEGQTANYGEPGDIILPEGTVSSIKVVENDTNIKAPVVKEINSSNPVFTFTEDTLNDKVKISDAIVTKIDKDSRNTLTITFNVGTDSTNYTLYIDNRYNDLSAFDTLEIGSTFSTYSWVGVHGTSYQFTYYEDLVVKAPELINPTSVELTSDKTEIKINETAKLSYTTEPINANATPTFTSSDDAIATVNEKGVVTGVSQGTATITITFEGGVTDSIDIDVSDEQLTVYSYNYNVEYHSDNTISNSIYSSGITNGDNQGALEVLNNFSNTSATSIFESVTECSYLYTSSKVENSGLKFSSSKVDGSITFNTSIEVKGIVINAICWKNDKSSITVNNSTIQFSANNGTTIENLAFNFDSATKTITISAKERFVITGIEFVI